MKKFQILGKSLLLAGVLAFTAACSGDDSPSGTGGHTGSYVTAKVDGANFDAAVMGVPVVTALRTGTGDATLIMISGSDPDGKSMSLNLFGITETGTYNIGPATNSVLAYLEGVGTATTSFDTGECAGATGTVNITQISEAQVEGTFTFTGKSEENECTSRSITEGSFRGVFMQ